MHLNSEGTQKAKSLQATLKSLLASADDVDSLLAVHISTAYDRITHLIQIQPTLLPANKI